MSTPPATPPPTLRHLSDLTPRLISATDTVKLALAAGPSDGCSTSVFFEVWEPGGSQPDNSHDGSTEIFVFLAGSGRAYSDDHVLDVGPGDVLVLPPGSVHRIENTSATTRMYTVTVMVDDDGALPGGFAELVGNGVAADFDASDLAVLSGPDL